MEKKTFAFKLVEKAQDKATEQASQKWAARDGVAVAGCTEFQFPGNFRFGTRFSTDGGIFC